MTAQEERAIIAARAAKAAQDAAIYAAQLASLEQIAASAAMFDAAQLRTDAAHATWIDTISAAQASAQAAASAAQNAHRLDTLAKYYKI